jgi:hypothetical protein
VDSVGLPLRFGGLDGLQLVVVFVLWSLHNSILLDGLELLTGLRLALQFEVLGTLQFDSFILLNGVGVGEVDFGDGVGLGERVVLALIEVVVLEAGDVVGEDGAHLLLHVDFEADEFLLGQPQLILKEDVDLEHLLVLGRQLHDYLLLQQQFLAQKLLVVGVAERDLLLLSLHSLLHRPADRPHLLLQASLLLLEMTNL